MLFFVDYAAVAALRKIALQEGLSIATYSVTDSVTKFLLEI